MWVLALLLLLVVAFLMFEDMTNRVHLKRIPHRIYVNGTRGKSSVTRLIAAALRAGGVRCIAKTTGTSPRFLFPDGSEVLIRRVGSPNIKEQLRTVRWSRQYEIDAIVVECMALNPTTQWLSAHRMVRPSISVITNARADHLDVMGPGVADVERALAGTVPDGGVLVTAEPTWNAVLKQACVKQGARYEQVTESEIAAISAEELDGFSYIEHAENVALALRVVSLLGIDRDVAVPAMHRATPDVGALTRVVLDFFGRRIVWVNGFAANDPDSTSFLWRRLSANEPPGARRLLVMNCREDRPDRSRQLGKLAAELQDVDRFVLIGSGTEMFARAAVLAGVNQERLYAMIEEPIEKIFERLISWSEEASLIMGIGNIKGEGKMLDEYFGNRTTVAVPGPGGTPTVPRAQRHDSAMG